MLSIDDFYFGKKDRNKLSKTASPLLVTRGVPGTHNLQHLKKVLKVFFSKKKTDLLITSIFQSRR